MTFSKSISRFAACSFALIVSACATLSKDECLSADWHHLGMLDGSGGLPLSRLNEHREACAEFGVLPDEAQYKAGRNSGLAVYCLPANAIKEGLAGRRYSGVCPLPAHQRFTELNRIAYAVHGARRHLDSLASRQRSLESELHNKKTSEEKRKQIRQNLRELDREMNEARDNLRWREHDLDRALL